MVDETVYKDEFSLLLKHSVMNKVYLTSVLPDSATVSKHNAPDVYNSLTNYRQEKENYRNIAPDIRPQPLEKYEISKAKEERIETHDVDEGGVQDVDQHDDSLDESDDITVETSAAIARLPKNYQAKGRRLLPYMFRIEWQNQPLDGLLYDLVVPSKHLLTPVIALKSVLTQLARLKDLRSSYYINKLELNKNAGTPLTVRMRQHHHPIATSTPRQAPKPPGRSSSPTFFTPGKSSSTVNDPWI